MTARARWFVAGCVLALIFPDVAQAGMAMFTAADLRRGFTLSNLTLERVEIISFFLLLLLLCAAVIRWIWNGLRKDFPILPRLSYGKALGIVALWGLLFVLVLTMIAGARELMTPGAWEKKGLLYQLAQPGPTPIEQQITERVEALERLRDALNQFAETHGHEFPTSVGTSGIPDALWQVPTTGGKRYGYISRPNTFRALVYEPDDVGPDRLVLIAAGWQLDLRWMPASEIQRILSKEAKP